MELLGPRLQLESQCEAVLRSLPQWFGIEEALRMYVADTARLPTFAFSENGAVMAFLSLIQHFPESWEIHCIAAHSNARNRGYGTALLEHAEQWLVGQGVKYLQVKTVAHTSKSAAYAETRQFYLARTTHRCRYFRCCGHHRIQRFSSSRCCMPIVDVEVVSAGAEPEPQWSVAALASALGRVFGSSPGRTWVRLQVLPASCYAENDAPLPGEALPVFVTVLQASPPQGAELQTQVEAVTRAVAAWVARPDERVHVGYAPAAAGRQAFGGKIV